MTKAKLVVVLFCVVVIGAAFFNSGFMSNLFNGDVFNYNVEEMLHSASEISGIPTNFTEGYNAQKALQK